MKNLESRLLEMLSRGYCVPRLADIAKALGEPGTTIHYNIKKLEKERKVLAYKAVFDQAAIGKSVCNYVLINTDPEEYSNPERIAGELSKLEEVESVDIITGQYEILIKVRTRTIDEFYNFVKKALSRKGFAKTTTITSLKQIKSEFVPIRTP